jgi:hypothetical protein
MSFCRKMGALEYSVWRKNPVGLWQSVTTAEMIANSGQIGIRKTGVIECR